MYRPALALASVFAMALMPGVPAGAAQPSTQRPVTFAEAPGSAPTYIFPFATRGRSSTANIEQFQYLMYRPLYWFGTAHSVTLDEGKSLARRPVFSDHDRTVTISLKPYRWSDGELLTARDILFWLNIWHVKPTAFYAWDPGGWSLPTSIRSVRLTHRTTIQLTLTHAVNPTWFTDDQLSTITPLPLAWTRTSVDGAPGSGRCAQAAFGTGDAACTPVYRFLSLQSGFDPTQPTQRPPDGPSTWASNPIWQVVDGPWRLGSFGATQPAVFVPNPHYSGPDKPRISEFVEEPYVSNTAERHALAAGAVNVGYLPRTALVTKTRSAPNSTESSSTLASRYRAVPVYAWAVDFATYNFDSTGGTRRAAPILRQLYVRQAMQLLVDQPALIRRWADGYGVPTVGPVPLVPHSLFLSSLEMKNPYPYDPRRAARLLGSHGWRVTPRGVDTCDRPGRGPHGCGVGIRRGATLTLTLHQPSGTGQLTGMFATEIRSWKRAGIEVTTYSATGALGVPRCPPTCRWEITFASGYDPPPYPSGQALFAEHYGVANGDYTSKENRTLIAKTERSKTNLHSWENYVATQLPFLFEPEFAQELCEIDTALRASPPGLLGTITPATWSWES